MNARLACWFLGCAGLTITAAGCGTENVIGSGRDPIEEEEGGDDGPCTDFVPGTNMLGVAWDGQVDESVSTAIQTIGDMAMTGPVAIGELAEACHGLAVALGSTPPALDEQPTREQASASCAVASDAVGRLRAEVDFSLEVVSAPACNLDAAKASCLTTCADDPTCDAYCTSSAIWSADCPPAEVGVVVEGEVDDELRARFDAIIVGVGLVLASQERAELITDRSSSLAEQVDDDFLSGVPTACIPLIVAALSDSVEDVQLLVESSVAITAAAGGG